MKKSKATINIGSFQLSKAQVGANEYEIRIFRFGKYESKFNLSLQPTGKDNELPTFQPFPKGLEVPKWVTKNIAVLSDWIIAGHY